VSVEASDRLANVGRDVSDGTFVLHPLDGAPDVLYLPLVIQSELVPISGPLSRLPVGAAWRTAAWRTWTVSRSPSMPNRAE
jgi:hypothetical protein